MRPNTSKCNQQQQQEDVNNRHAETSTTTLNPLKLAESTRFGETPPAQTAGVLMLRAKQTTNSCGCSATKVTAVTVWV